jgi:hypothetical protein
MPIHVVSVSNATSSPTLLLQGGSVKANFTTNNPGDYNETVTINSYYQNGTSLLFKTTTITLKPGRSAFLQSSWNTTISVPSKYQIVIIALPVPGESVRLYSHNTALAGNTTVLPIAEDIDRNGRVDIVDVALVAAKFGTSIGLGDIDHDCKIDISDVAFVAFYFGTKVGDPKWNPLADLNGDGKVDVVDVAIVARNFGQVMGPEDINHDCRVDILDMALVAARFGFGT